MKKSKSPKVKKSLNELEKVKFLSRLNEKYSIE